MPIQAMWMRMASVCVLLTCAAASVSAQTSRLYLTQHSPGAAASVQDGQLVRAFSPTPGTGECGIVVTDTVKIIQAWPGNSAGSEYDLDGARVRASVYPNNSFDSLYDGATDGEYFYSVAHNGFPYSVYRFDTNWANGQLLFTPQERCSGITYDAVNDTLWVTATVGTATQVVEYSKAGQRLSSFNCNVFGGYGLAWDRADDTFWVTGYSDFRIHQFSRDGQPLQSLTPGHGFNAHGAEFQFEPCPELALGDDQLPDAVSGAEYDETLVADGGSGAYEYSISDGALPQGVELDTSGRIQGVPVQVGDFSFTVSVFDTDTFSCTTEFELNLLVRCADLTISPASLPAGVMQTAYAQQLTVASGVAPVEFSLESGTLPQGLSLDDDGRLTGAPLQAGTFAFTVLAEDSSDPGCTSQADYSIIVQQADVEIDITVEPNPVLSTEPVSVVVTLDGAAGTPTGEVELLIDGDPVDEDDLRNGEAEFELDPLPAGTYSVQAVYAGSGAYGPAESAVIDLLVEDLASPSPTVEPTGNDTPDTDSVDNTDTDTPSAPCCDGGVSIQVVVLGLILVGLARRARR